MVAKKKAHRSRRLPGCFLPLLCFWACLAGLALPSLARATQYTAPTTPFTEPTFGVTAPTIAGEGGAVCTANGFEGQSTHTEVSLYTSALALKQICRLIDEGNRKIGSRLFWQVDETVALREEVEKLGVKANEQSAEIASNTKGLSGQLANLDADLLQLHEDLTPSEGTPVRLASQAGPLSVESPAGVEVTNPPNVAAVEAAVTELTETDNQNAWAIAGLAFGLAAVCLFVWKAVRP